MSWDNPTDFEMGLADRQGRMYPESRQCHLCVHIGEDGNPNDESLACQICSRNDARPELNDGSTIKDHYELGGPDEPDERSEEV